MRRAGTDAAQTGEHQLVVRHDETAASSDLFRQGVDHRAGEWFDRAALLADEMVVMAAGDLIVRSPIVDGDPHDPAGAVELFHGSKHRGRVGGESPSCQSRLDVLERPAVALVAAHQLEDLVGNDGSAAHAWDPTWRPGLMQVTCVRDSPSLLGRESGPDAVLWQANSNVAATLDDQRVAARLPRFVPLSQDTARPVALWRMTAVSTRSPARSARTRRKPSHRAMWARILFQALRWRRLSALTLFAVAVVAVASSAAGPIFLRAADDSSLTTALAQAPPGRTDVSFTTAGGPSALAHVKSAGRVVKGLGRGRWFSSPVYTVDAGITVDASGQVFNADLLSRSGVCSHVRMVAGACPLRGSGVAMSARSARLAGVRLGQEVRATPPKRTFPTISLRVVGLYDPPATVANRYWGDTNYFAFGTSVKGVSNLDALLAGQSTALSATSLGEAPQVRASSYLRAGRLRSPRVGALEADVRGAFSKMGSKYSLAGSTRLFAALSAVRHHQSLMATVVEGVVLQLVLLALLVLYSVVSASCAQRHGDVEIARRRGFSRLSLLAVAAAEPVGLLVAALPVGFLAAWAVTALGARGLFVAGTPVGPTPLAALGALAGVAGGIVTAVVASSSLLRARPSLAEGASRRRSAAVALDAVAVALAAAGLVVLAAGGSLGGSRPDPLASLAPGLLAVGAGVIGLRLAGLAFRALVAPTRGSRHVAWFLTVREIARRRPAPLRQMLPLGVAVVLAVFAVSSWALVSANRARLATFATGAPRVLDVSLRPGVDLVSAVRHADPSGSYAMAAATYSTSNGNLLAVQASRLASVAEWPAGLSPVPVEQVARYLDPKVASPVEFAAGSLRAVITLPSGTPSISLAATVFNLAGQDHSSVYFPTLHPGTATYTVSLGGFCASTCRLVALRPSFASSSTEVTSDVHMTLRSLAASDSGPRRRGASRQLSFGAGSPASWRATPSAVSVSTRSGSRNVSFSLPGTYLGTQGILLSPADVPSPIPAVVTDQLASTDSPAPPDNSQSVPGLDGNAIDVAGEIQVPDLPRIGSDAALVDLTFAQLSQVGPAHPSYQVWMSSSAPASVIRRLEAEGVTVTSTQRAARLASRESRGPLALAYTFVLFAAPVAAALAAGAAAFALVSSSRRRREEMAALAVVGVTRRTVLASVLAETGLVLATTLAVGCAVGVGASDLALASLPEFAAGTSGVPIDHSAAWVAVVAVVGAFAALFAITSAVVTYLVLARRGREDEGEGGR